MEFTFKNRHRIKTSKITRLWARVWRLAVIEARRQENCRCAPASACRCAKVSDYRLSVMFQPPNREGYSPTERLRIFEGIAANGSLPADGKHHKRKGFDIVSEVAKRPGYGWTKDVFESPLWFLLINPHMSPSTLSRFLVHCLSRVIPQYRQPFEKVEEMLANDLGVEVGEDFFLIVDPALAQVYDGNFPSQYLTEFNLDDLALIGALFKDAYLAGALHMAVLLEGAFLRMVEQVQISLDWLDDEINHDFGKLCIETILRSHTTISFEDYPDHIKTFNATSAGNLNQSALNFLLEHRARVQRDFLIPPQLTKSRS